jgi:hypothetical protein
LPPDSRPILHAAYARRPSGRCAQRRYRMEAGASGAVPVAMSDWDAAKARLTFWARERRGREAMTGRPDAKTLVCRHFSDGRGWVRTSDLSRVEARAFRAPESLSASQLSRPDMPHPKCFKRARRPGELRLHRIARVIFNAPRCHTCEGKGRGARRAGSRQKCEGERCATSSRMIRPAGCWVADRCGARHRRSHLARCQGDCPASPGGGEPCLTSPAALRVA